MQVNGSPAIDAFHVCSLPLRLFSLSTRWG